MSKKLIMFILTIILTIGVSFYLRTRTVSTSLEDQYQRFETVSFEGAFYNFGPFRANSLDIYQDVDSIDELVQKSQVIAKVSFIKRQQKYKTFYTTVKVEEIFKGKLESHEIVIFEPITIRENILSIESVHKPMDVAQDYIVFLQGALPEDNKHFNLVNSCVGLFPVKSKLYVKKLAMTEKGTENIVIDRDEFENYDFFDIAYDYLEENSFSMEYGSVIDGRDIYEKTKSLFYNNYKLIMKKYAHIEGNVIFEDK